VLKDCMLSGVRGARRNVRLVALLWLSNLALAGFAALPVWRWWRSAFDRAPEADRLLERFNLSVIREVAQYDRSPVWSLVLASSFAALGVAILGNAFLNGGTLEVLLARDAKPLLHRFCRGGGHYFLRYLGLLFLSGLGGLAAVALVSLVLRAGSLPFANSGSEVVPVLVSALQAAGALMIAGVMYLVLDYARIEMAAADSRRVLRTWIRGLQFALTRAGGTFGLIAAAAAATGLLFGLYALFRDTVPSNTPLLIALMIVAQQVFIIARIGIRTALLGAELELFAANTAPSEPIAESTGELLVAAAEASAGASDSPDPAN
jgi:hypothetical protein